MLVGNILAFNCEISGNLFSWAGTERHLNSYIRWTRGSVSNVHVQQWIARMSRLT